MIIEINPNTLLLGIITISIVIAIIYLIITLRKVLALLDNLNKTLVDNKSNLDNTFKNLSDITDNVKDISDVAIETTAEALVVKEDLINRLDLIKDIANIIAGVFLKK
ncbi:hypothetical protein [Clostridium septicum]|uniref:hypothetical protein n=1 Tax=Clostridium septicum TaxID=1504 RepID=UPI00082E68F1|nr:hypothetical protein [Clostridium septicum]